MVYLIDDKKFRQELDYSWTNERFNSFSSVITCVYTLEELHQKADDIFSENNIILYHESFIDQTYLSNEAIEKRNKLNTWSKNKNNLVVYFSGSKNTREINDNIAYIPVSTLYSNLEIFLNKITNKEFNLNYLLFGEKINIEKDLNEILDISLSLTFNEEPVNIIGATFFIRPFKKYISNPFLYFEEGIIFSDVSDNKLSEKTNEWFNEVHYEHIFIPLCFGEILSDYNGLRLATHLRCTENINQLSSIYIYGFTDIERLIHNEYFDILKTKNVFYVPFSKKSFLEFSKVKKESYLIEELSEQLKKINLEIPKNYEDSHSIANEWAIHRWSKYIGVELNTALEALFVNIANNIYFKFLKTINPINSIDVLSNNELKINCKKKIRILLIDDEVNKGWGNLFTYIFKDLNNIYFNYIGDGFKFKNSDEIIQISFDKIVKDEIDIVILDFRLNNEDFTIVNPNNTSSLKLLKKIKKYNPGIQVITFSASNKIWNFSNMQNAGSDNFILKESPFVKTDISFSRSAIRNFPKSIMLASKMSFLKKIYFKISDIKDLFINSTNNDDPDFVIRLRNNLNIAYKLLEDTKQSTKYFNYAFLQLFQIIEDYSKLPYVFKEDSDCFVYVNNKEICVCKSLKDGWETAISFTNKYSIAHKYIANQEKRKRLETNYIVSAILIFRLGFENSSALQWTKINKIRNTKAAHFNIEDALSEDEIIIILDFIFDFINPCNQDESNLEKGLKIKTFKESLDYLKDHFKNK